MQCHGHVLYRPHDGEVFLPEAEWYWLLCGPGKALEQLHQFAVPKLQGRAAARLVLARSGQRSTYTVRPRKFSLSKVGAVDAGRLGDLIGRVTPEEQWGIDEALVTVLGLR